MNAGTGGDTVCCCMECEGCCCPKCLSLYLIRFLFSKLDIYRIPLVSKYQPCIVFPSAINDNQYSLK